jgi:hypothetical protein
MTETMMETWVRRLGHARQLPLVDIETWSRAWSRVGHMFLLGRGHEGDF